MEKQINDIKWILIFFFLGILISSCAPKVQFQEANQTTSTAKHDDTPTQTAINPNNQLSTINVTLSPLELTSLDGPLLLLQTSVDAFHILDLATHELIPFDFPGTLKDQSLSSILSPDGKHLISFTNEQKLEIINIISKETSFAYDFYRDTLGIDLDEAVESALQIFEGYTNPFMRDLINQTIAQGQQNIQWYKGDQALLIITLGPGVTSNLTLLDLSTGETRLLEQNLRFVEDYWLGPGDEKVLLKKGYSRAPNDWQDDQYFLIDLVNGTSIEIPMPANSDSPSIYWFSDVLLGVIHQTSIYGGTDFSLIRIPDMVSNLVVTGTFSKLYTFGSDILMVYQDLNTQTTNLTLQSINGDLISSQEIAGICSSIRKTSGSSLLLNCETDSYLVEGQELTIANFGNPIFLISRSSDRQYYVLITKEKNCYLVSIDLLDQKPIQLQGEPLEIIWLPDSSGFLYRTARELIRYDISGGTNDFILSSDLFGDYRNLNAVWLKLD